MTMGLTTVGAVPLALLFAALSRRMPDVEGRPYAYARAAFGNGRGFVIACIPVRPDPGSGRWRGVRCTVTFVPTRGSLTAMGRARPGREADQDDVGVGTSAAAADDTSKESMIMSKILVSYASRTGTTHEVANALAEELRRLGQDVDVLPCRRSPSAYHYDAVVLGSAVHRSQWLPEALGYLKAEAPDLSERPTWLFQTAPCSDGEVEGHVGFTAAPARVLEHIRDIGAAGPATFSRPEGDAGPVPHPSRWIATGPCFGPFGSEDGARTWAEMIAAFTPDHRARRQDDDELDGGAGPGRQHPLAAAV